MDYKYGQGQFVKCFSVTKENHEGLVLGDIYKVLGAEQIGDDVVYSLMSHDGKIIYSIDRFELTNYIQETAHKIKINVPLMSATSNPKIPSCGIVSTGSTFDTVMKPQHYTDRKVEVIDYIEDNMSFEAMNGWLEGNVIKYISRYKSKNGVQDLKKARFYLDRLIRRMED